MNVARCWCGLSLAVALLAGVVHAQVADEEADHEALRRLRTVFEQAVRDNNLDLMAPYIDPEFSVVSFTDREFTSFDAYKTQWQITREQLLQGGTYTVTLLPVRSQILGNLAIAKGDSENVLVTGQGKRFTFGAHWTVVLRKTDGQWRVLRAHYSLDPFGNPMVRSGFRKVAMQIAGVSAAIGLILGAAGGYWLRRR
ncbi:MAG: nuclear transport factor 2 family protein [Lentisphaerae bacterium]|nr:nuclear transport factor 2 family protein [Lentisphaerota bacterium]